MQYGSVRLTGILVAALLLASCVKSAKPANAASAEAAGSEPSVTAPAPATQPPQPSPQQPPSGSPGRPLTLTRETASAANAAVVKRDRGLLALYSLDPQRTAFPEDFRIGPLTGAGVTGLSSENAETLRTAAALLSGLSKKKIADDLLLPDRKVALSRFLDDAIAKGEIPLRFRLGSVNRTEESQSRVNVRLFGSEGSANGELFFRKDENRWLVADIQLRFDALAEKQPPDQERYFPSTYRWLLDEF